MRDFQCALVQVFTEAARRPRSTLRKVTFWFWVIFCLLLHHQLGFT